MAIFISHQEARDDITAHVLYRLQTSISQDDVGSSSDLSSSGSRSSGQLYINTSNASTTQVLIKASFPAAVSEACFLLKLQLRFIHISHM